jgi:hypothetical protein
VTSRCEGKAPSKLDAALASLAGASAKGSFAQAEALHETFGFTPAKLSGPAAIVTAIVLALAQLAPELSK